MAPRDGIGSVEAECTDSEKDGDTPNRIRTAPGNVKPGKKYNLEKGLRLIEPQQEESL